jgi:uncharacterized protein (DUF433 family)
MQMNDVDNVIAAFTADQVVRLTGLSSAQLAYWDRTGFFQPRYASEDRHSPYSRIYSFKDVVGLRTLSILKGGHNVSLPHLREVAQKLSNYTKTPWSDLKLKVWKRKVQFDEPETGRTRGVVDGQYVLLPIIDVMEDMKRRTQELNARDDSQIGQLERHRYVSHNSLVLAGTRIPVASIVRLAEDGYTPEQIMKEYPRLTKADVAAALRYAGETKAA